MTYCKRIIILLTLSIATLAHGQQNPFIGTWQLVSGEYLDHNNKLVSYQSLDLVSQKVINKNHFSFISTKAGKFWSAGTGSYSFNEKTYIESPTIASYQLEDGGHYQFDYQIKGDLWYNARWRDKTRVEFEVWQKVK
ncbi:hypothetical protein [Thalassotalea sp. G2M2-11]|uniref:hypothetical protein n=1 Tax=Thalassotalea sp. G2M2-11 TaxID=2787627 RepID=UPI0019D0B638|nr:hypothetical protein [Thalassotalea sp. G2M2-11]